ncbi:MAG: arsenate reductase ArsC [Gemmataceae bacterium]|nr:arsenate reductase ArsC [Gemmataceae bacterium]
MRIVFVCVENSCRSQIAEAFARLAGRADVEVYSSGSRPSGQVNPKAIATMRAIGYDLTTHRSKGLDELPQVEFNWAITMGCGDECPNLRARHRADWGIPNPKQLSSAEFDEMRDLIGAKVRELLAGTIA